MGLAPVQRLAGWESETRTPTEIINASLPQADDALKREFLNLAHARAEKTLKINSEIDASSSTDHHNALGFVWAMVKEASSSLRYFFLHLKDQSVTNMPDFTDKLARVLDRARLCLGRDDIDTRIRPYPIERVQGAGEVTNRNNFIPGSNSLAGKSFHLTKAHNHINRIRKRYEGMNLAEPPNLIKNIVEMAEIEARLDPVIGGLMELPQSEPRFAA